MATHHLGTTVHTPTWSQTDAEVSPSEQKRRLSVFRISVLQELEEDCTRVVNFCEEWHDAGLYATVAPTWEAFCHDRLGIDAAWVEKLCTGLRLLRAGGVQGPVPASLATQVADVQALAQHGTNQYTEHGPDNVKSTSGQGGNSRHYLVARLKRDHPAIAADLAAGKFKSVRAAAKAAGVVQEPTPLARLDRLWRTVAPEDRLRFLAAHLTPDECRALLLRVTDAEPS
jgi:hypothetical protein